MEPVKAPPFASNTPGKKKKNYSGGCIFIREGEEEKLVLCGGAKKKGKENPDGKNRNQQSVRNGLHMGRSATI